MQLLTFSCVASTVWKGQLTFGLVSFAVRLVRAARKDRIPLRYVRQTRSPAPTEPGIHEDEPEASVTPETIAAPVRQTYIAPDDEQPVSAGELQRGYEVEPGRFAVLRSEEIQRLRQPTSSEMQIVRSVRMEEIDPVFLETSYYVHPGNGADHSYTLFYRALQESGYAALAEVAMHGRQHVMVIRTGPKGLIAHTMYYVNEVRQGEEHVTGGDVPAKELDLAKRFVEAIAAPFSPEEFTDRYREQLQALIASKETVPSATAEAPAPAASAKVIDIMDALQKSLEKVRADKERVRKPAARAASTQKARKRRA
ncbi:MAG TPA: Ku protein [Bryobacteraceae bacterium]|nr:Ku protein [Bryobacteraceae bacterium]